MVGFERLVVTSNLSSKIKSQILQVIAKQLNDGLFCVVVSLFL